MQNVWTVCGNDFLAKHCSDSTSHRVETGLLHSHIIFEYSEKGEKVNRQLCLFESVQ